MKLEVEMLFRVRGDIGIVKKLYKDENGKTTIVGETINNCINKVHFNLYSEEFISIIEKASHNIIDLIEVGDIVRTDCYKEEITGIITDEDGDMCLIGTDGYGRIYDYDIKSILTKEQFASMEYKIGDE